MWPEWVGAFGTNLFDLHSQMSPTKVPFRKPTEREVNMQPTKNPICSKCSLPITDTMYDGVKWVRPVSTGTQCYEFNVWSIWCADGHETSWSEPTGEWDF